jgi:hypothetical protein
MNALQTSARIEAPMSAPRRTAILVIWMFPYLLAAGAYFSGAVYEPAMALRAPVAHWPIPPAAYGGLLVLVLIAIAWLIGEFFSVTSRETVVMALQLDALLSTTAAILFTGAAGWFIGTGNLQWWFIVPWIATIIDALTAGWLGINNAAQKPFFGKQGTN